MKITPTVGRVVWFYPANNQATSGFTPPTEGEPLAAIIARVVDADAGAVHLAVFDSAGVSRSEPYVKLVQEGEKVPADGRYATWMPYQVDQAKKHANEVARADEPKSARADWAGTGLDFGTALLALKDGKRVARAGWNGSGQWVALGKGADYLAASQFWNEHARAHAEQNGGGATVRPYFILKTAQGDILMGWSPSQSDALAEDWHTI